MRFSIPVADRQHMGDLRAPRFNYQVMEVGSQRAICWDELMSEIWPQPRLCVRSLGLTAITAPRRTSLWPWAPPRETGGSCQSQPITCSIIWAPQRYLWVPHTWLTPDESFCPGLVDEFDPRWVILIQQGESVDQQERFMDLISNGQRGRMDDQRCSLDPSRSAPCTPSNSRKVDANSAGEICLCSFLSLGFSFWFHEILNLLFYFSRLLIYFQDSDKFFSLLANTQSRRLDDQRVSLPSLPGLQKEQEKSTSGTDSSYLCYMVSKVQVSSVLWKEMMGPYAKMFYFLLNFS